MGSLCRLYLWDKARHGACMILCFSIGAAYIWDNVSNHLNDNYDGVTIMFLAFGLGALNTSISRDGLVVMPLSYVTGTLVKMAQGITLHLTKVKKWIWLPQLITYISFIGGAAIGGVIFTFCNANISLLVLFIFSLLLSMLVWHLDNKYFIGKDSY